MPQDNIVDFNGWKQRQNARADAPRQEAVGIDPGMLTDVLDILNRLPDSRLMKRANHMIWDRLTRLLFFVECTSCVNRFLEANGFDPDAFAPDAEAFNRFLTLPFKQAGVSDAPETMADIDPELLWNGPCYDRYGDSGELMRAAVTVFFEEDHLSGVSVDLMKTGPGEHCWRLWQNGEWSDGGPEREIFDYLADLRADMPDDGGAPDGIDRDDLWGLDLDLSSAQRLRRAGIHTVAELTQRTEAELLALPGIGPGTVSRIREALTREGLCLKS